MTEAFSTTTIDQIAKRLGEPAWLTELRRQALTKHLELSWPHTSDDIWRRTDVSLLDPMRGFAPATPTLHERLPLSEAQLAALTKPLGRPNHRTTRATRRVV